MGREQLSALALSTFGPQTDKQVIMRYWDLPREQIIEMAALRAIPECGKYRVTRSELAHIMLRQDLGSC